MTTKSPIETNTAEEKKREQSNFNLVASAFGLPPRPLYSPVSRGMKRYAQTQNGKRVATLTHAELEKLLRLDGLTTTEDQLKRGIRLADGSLVKDTLATGHHEITPE
jgi:hypothetical protein